MKTNSQTTDPMYIFEYDETYEHHETHSEENLNPFSELCSRDQREQPFNPLTFYEWYQNRLTHLTASNELAKATCLKHCYYEILHYGIFHRSMGYDISDTLLILQCTRLCSNYFA